MGETSGGMRWTRLSFIYLVGYLSLGGVGLLLAPELGLQALGAQASYSPALVRLVGACLLAIGIIVIQIARHRAETLYPTALLVRAVLLGTIVALYFQSRDRFFLVLTAVVGLGMLLTTAGLLIDRRDKHAPSRQPYGGQVVTTHRPEGAMNSSPSPYVSPLLAPVLRVFGLIFILGIGALNRVWPSGWAWAPEQPAYLHMVWGIYATLGAFLFWAARDPARHVSLLWFTVWSSVVHAAVMAVHSFTDPGQMGHLWGDVAALLLTAALLSALVPRAVSTPSRA